MTPPQVLPHEQLRCAGQKLGLWRNGYDFKNKANYVFGGSNLSGRRMLEIGCGTGEFCSWAALHGASEVIGLEPLADGAGHLAGCHKTFSDMAQLLHLTNTKILPYTLQDYEGPDAHFDLVLSVASVNHLDESVCIHLRDEPKARRVYVEIFRKINRLLKPNGKLILLDCGANSFYSDCRFKNPFNPNIEWFKHQNPDLWISMLCEAGFAQPIVSWSAIRPLRYLGIRSVPRGIAYLTTSYFRLEMIKRLAPSKPAESRVAIEWNQNCR